MKKVLKGLFSFFGLVYLVLAIFIIICLLNTNELGTIELGNNTLIIIDNDEVSSSYKKNDLIVVPKVSNKDVNENDMIFFYEEHYGEVTVNLANVVSKYDVNEKETTFTVKDNYSFSGSKLIGRVNDSVKYTFVGGLISTLTSKWGFLFLIILPFFLIFLYELYAILREIKQALKEAK